MHALRSLLLHLDGSPGCSDRIRVARALAGDFDARVTALYAVSPSMTRHPLGAEGMGMRLVDFSALDDRNRDRARRTFEAVNAGDPRLTWAELVGDAPWGFARQALYADLVILGRRHADDAASVEVPGDFTSRLLLDTGRPALLLPQGFADAAVGRKVLVGWTQSREAARAVHAALPWLQRAHQVHLACFAENATDQLASLRTYLHSHGVEGCIHHESGDRSRAGESLLEVGRQVGADLLVMGCYGHSRTREWVFGGATRTALLAATLPVLMVH